MTNADIIRNMPDEELAMIIMCPYDTAGEEIMPCILDGEDPEFMPQGRCFECTTKWLKKEAKESDSADTDECKRCAHHVTGKCDTFCDHGEEFQPKKEKSTTSWSERIMQRFTGSK